MIATSSDEESVCDEEREDFPSLVSRPELHFGLFDAYVGDHGAFATHESEPTDTHYSQSKGEPKVAAAHSSKAGGGSSAKDNFGSYI